MRHREARLLHPAPHHHAIPNPGAQTTEPLPSLQPALQSSVLPNLFESDTFQIIFGWLVVFCFLKKKKKSTTGSLAPSV